MENITIGLVQINNSFSGAGYFPYSAGLMQAYYQEYGQYTDSVVFLDPIFDRCSVEQALAHLEGASLAAFSTYAWNFEISVAIASALKTKDPNTVILFGGPQVPRDAKAFLYNHPFIDIVCQGEGERILTAVIDKLHDRDFSSVPSISYRTGNGITTSAEFERFTELALIPSPYLSGVFDPLLKKYPDRQWLGLWETNRGCPFSCAFCDWGAPEQRKVYQFPLDRVKAELLWFAKNKIEFIFCCDSNFGMFERDVELAQYASKLNATYGYPKALSVQNAKNATDRIIRVQEELARGTLNKGVTLALQSATPAVLESVNRKNIAFPMFSHLQRHFTEKGIETYTDMILCLPEETYESFITGVDKVVESGQYNRIQFINLSILPNSQMADPAYIEHYGLKSVNSNCINIHGQRNAEGAIQEKQQLVIASSAMPEEDWLKTRSWSWMCAFLFFDKALQLPLTLASTVKRIPLSRLISAFLIQDARYPILSEITSLFHKEAKAIQQGGPEYYYSEEFLGIYWPHDEYCLIKLTAAGQWDAFYAECHTIIKEAVNDAGGEAFTTLLEESIALNRAMMKTPTEDMAEVVLEYPILEYFHGIVANKPVSLRRETKRYHIHKANEWESLNDWARRVVWWGNKKAAYWWPVTITKG